MKPRRTLRFRENTRLAEQLTELGLNIAGVLHQEEEYEYLAPLSPGETLTGVITVLDGTTRKGPHRTFIDLVTLHYATRIATDNSF